VIMGVWGGCKALLELGFDFNLVFNLDGED
jgi:hypothetical protein